MSPMKSKRDFKRLIGELKQTRLKAKRSIKKLYKGYNSKVFEYDKEARAIESKNEGIIMICDKVLNRIDRIFKTST